MAKLKNINATMAFESIPETLGYVFLSKESVRLGSVYENEELLGLTASGRLDIKKIEYKTSNVGYPSIRSTNSVSNGNELNFVASKNNGYTMLVYGYYSDEAFYVEGIENLGSVNTGSDESIMLDYVEVSILGW